MKKINYWFLKWFLLFIVVVGINLTGNYMQVTAMEVSLSIAEIAQTADLICIGTVDRQMCQFNNKEFIITEVYFTDIEIVHETERSKQKKFSEIQLSYAGGQVGDKGMRVNDAPILQEGHRYLMFLQDDGKVYMNPVVGGRQGLFEIIHDMDSQKEYLLTPSKKAVVGINTEGIKVSRKRVSHIKNGRIIEEEPKEQISERFKSQLPSPSNPNDSVRQSDILSKRTDDELQLLSLKEFVDFIKNIALKTHLGKKRLKRGSQGRFYRRQNGKMEVEDFKSIVRQKLPTLGEKGNNTTILEVTGESDKRARIYSETVPVPKGGTLGYCGIQSLPIVMEQVPEDWFCYDDNEFSVSMWNNFMDIYRKYADDGNDRGNNGVNEFVGFLDDSQLYNAYGFNWGSGLAVCITYSWDYYNCTEILETDIAFNNAYSWTDDEDYALGNYDVILYRPAVNHEVGHSWGYQQGIYEETYDYDYLSVMHPYYFDIVENGRGIHHPDAYLIRRAYDSQTGILDVVDVGVESYYASDGLHNAETDKSSYFAGENITIEDVTVENMCYNDISDLRIRFYLSTNRTISTKDYQMGGYYYWTTSTGEAYNVDTYTMTIPSDIPPGTYYVGAMVTVDGFEDDDYTSNNTMTLYDTITVQLPNQAPNGVIDTPGGDMTINVGGSVNFTGTGTDPDNNTPLNYLWSFGSGSGISDSAQEDPGLKQFNTAGAFKVSFTVTDTLGLADPTPSTRTITVAPCEAESIDVFPSGLTLTSNNSDDVTVTVKGETGCLVEGVTVTSEIISKNGWKRISVSPESQLTDSNGQAVFEITAKKKKGRATVEFDANGLKTYLNVKVKK